MGRSRGGPTTRKESFPFSARVYRQRNAVERFFNKLKHFRAVATRYDKRDDNFLASIQLASIPIWLRTYWKASAVNAPRRTLRRSPPAGRKRPSDGPRLNSQCRPRADLTTCGERKRGFALMAPDAAREPRQDAAMGDPAPHEVPRVPARTRRTLSGPFVLL